MGQICSQLWTRKYNTAASSSLGVSNSVRDLQKEYHTMGMRSLDITTTTTTTRANTTTMVENTPAAAAAAVEYVVALHSYSGSGSSEFSFEKGTKLEVIDKNDEDWWLARFPGENELRYIPVPYVALVSSLESQEWYYGQISRMKATQLLLSPHNSPGAFLVRKSDNIKNYVISVRTFQMTGSGTYEPDITHYPIRNTRDGQFYFYDTTFRTLHDLVDFFVSQVNVKLLLGYEKHVCVRPTPTMQDLSWDVRDVWEISREEVDFIRLLGEGHFGEVWLGKWRKKFDVAVKTVKGNQMRPKEFLEEAKVMKTLRHPHILVLHAVCTDHLLIVTEYMNKGSLLHVLRTENVEPKLQIYMTTQIADGMKYLEELELIHRDLAARNVLVNDLYVCKVGDFGLAKLYQDANYYESKESRGKVAIKWTAPEAISHGKYTCKSDVWSFGVLVMEMMTKGALPYYGYKNEDYFPAIMKGVRMEQPPHCPDEVYQLILKCWNINPIQRPSFSFIYDFFDDYDIQLEASYSENNLM